MEIDIYKKGRRPYPAWVTGGAPAPRRNPRSKPKGGHHARPGKGARRPAGVTKKTWLLAKVKTNKVNDARRAQVEAARAKVAKAPKKPAAAAKRKPSARKPAARRAPARRSTGASKTLTRRVAALETGMSTVRTRLGKVEGTVKSALGRRLAAFGAAAKGRGLMHGPGRKEFEANKRRVARAKSKGRGLMHGPGRAEFEGNKKAQFLARMKAGRAAAAAKRARGRTGASRQLPASVAWADAAHQLPANRTNPKHRSKGRKTSRRGRR